MMEVKVGEDISLGEFEEFDREGLSSLFNRLNKQITTAEEQGLKDVFVTFASTMEPYDPYSCGPVKVQFRGYRPYTQRELDRQEEERKINALAKELGITPYEAAIVLDLRGRGKI